MTGMTLFHSEFKCQVCETRHTSYVLPGTKPLTDFKCNFCRRGPMELLYIVPVFFRDRNEYRLKFLPADIVEEIKTHNPRQYKQYLAIKDEEFNGGNWSFDAKKGIFPNIYATIIKRRLKEDKAGKRSLTKFT